MCTLSWLRQAGGGGYSVFFNRDELRSRLPARPPGAFYVGRTEAMAPTDGDAGGTWIGVNQFGVTLALLNRYEDTPHEPPTVPVPVSRGWLVRCSLEHRNRNALLQATTETVLKDFRPFTLGIFTPETDAALLVWNGTTRRVLLVAQDGLVATSSGHDQAGAERHRQKVFDALRPLTPEGLERAHASHLPERGPYSVCMHRSDARTVSYTCVTVTPGSCTLGYVDGPPGEGGPRTDLSLARGSGGMGAG